MDSSSAAQKNRNAETIGASALQRIIVKDAKYWELKYIKLFNKRKALLAAMKKNKLISEGKNENERPTIEFINVNVNVKNPLYNMDVKENQLGNASGKTLKEESIKSRSKQVYKYSKTVCSECYTKSGFSKIITRTHSHVLVKR